MRMHCRGPGEREGVLSSRECWMMSGADDRGRLCAVCDYAVFDCSVWVCGLWDFTCGLCGVVSYCTVLQ